jgi:glyoxylase-like metal-dependent hydrolase (beta-lactamase superfamily II)
MLAGAFLNKMCNLVHSNMAVVMKLKTIFSCVLSLLLTPALFAQEVFKNSDLTITPIDQGVWVVETSDMTTMYIVEGSKRALLIDTGTKCDSLDRIVRRITSKPLDVVVTHNHPDHAGNIRYFDTVYMHPADTVIRMGIEFKGTYKWLKDGDVFDLGDRKLEALLMSGHTPGSVVLFDKNIHACYASDAFGTGQVWLQLLPHVPMTTYYKSCLRMEKVMREQQTTKIYCGHYPFIKRTLGLDYMIEMRDLAKRLSEGDTSGSRPYQMPFKSNFACDKPAVVTNGSATIVYDSEHIN